MNWIYKYNLRKLRLKLIDQLIDASKTTKLHIGEYTEKR